MTFDLSPLFGAIWRWATGVGVGGGVGAGSPRDGRCGRETAAERQRNRALVVWLSCLEMAFCDVIEVLFGLVLKMRPKVNERKE